MATGCELRPRSSTQQGISDSSVDYYDIMVIGKTGMGKSTTADKLLIANLHGQNYQGKEHEDPQVEGEHMNLDDISVWLLSDADDELERVKTRLKNLVFFRSLDKPHEEINGFHSAEQNIGSSTLSCELISNESTEVRVLDVPGFFGQGTAGEPGTSLNQKGQYMVGDAIRIMRKILHIQSAMDMRFRRILYFLPERGPLERSSTILEMELTTMANYFGKSIFDCMVVITTVPEMFYKVAPDVRIPDTEIAKTRKHFDAALSRALQLERKKLPVLPIVFVSMMESCEKIYANITSAPVVCNSPVRLEFESIVCARCGIQAQIINNERVAAYITGPVSGSIPYEESTCHPLCIPKFTKIERFFGGVAHIMTFKRFLGKWPTFGTLDEVCVECQQPPGTQGCMRVKTKYKIKNKEIIVEHTNKVKEAVTFDFESEQVAVQPGQGQPDCVQQTTFFEGPAQDIVRVCSGIPDRQDTPNDYADTKG